MTDHHATTPWDTGGDAFIDMLRGRQRQVLAATMYGDTTGAEYRDSTPLVPAYIQL
ncbi:hypothetical protein ACT3SZ_14435 [Corynebacterium sp. AOP40-9SA-29]|uniref:hypothetical protein n=1 Tax=Corynebacterium sp. AOP40-9SA-29 TaxID=3457677 RepID=UPI0040345596